MHASNRLHKFFPFPTVLPDPDPDPDPTCFASPSQTSKKQQQWTAVGELVAAHGRGHEYLQQDGGLDAKCRHDAGIGAKYREFPTKMHSFKVQT
jgi:hypothetical protein